MGSAIVRGAVRERVVPVEEILIVEPDAVRRQAMDDLGGRTSDDPAAASIADMVMLAVKPQVFPEVAARLAPLSQPTVVLSIMAGVESRAIRAALGSVARVVRAMPNTPCQVGAGMTAIALGDGAKPPDLELPRRIFAALGTVAIVPEELMHAVTAVSGSGPAYVFLLAEAMEAAARSLGFSPADARTFVRQTIVGAGQL